jgi:hypothetical protein
VNDKASVLAELAHVLSEQAPELSLAHRLCVSASAVLGAEGGAITVAYTSEDRVTLCATDEPAERLEDLQDVLAQGPGPTAYLSGRQIRAALGTGGDERWPEFDRIASATFGRMDVRAIPMRPHVTVLGVLTCHLPETAERPFDESAAQFLADAVAVALLQDPAAYATHTGGPWASRAQIHQATGMVVAQLGIRSADALALLRAHAFAHDVSLERVAVSVIRRELDFRSPTNPDGSSPS